MRERFDRGALTIYPVGRIDSGNAGAVGSEIDAILARYTDFRLVLDLTALQYVSSAGLRIILKLRKRFADIALINASSEVYDILDMTGMTEMMTVVKAFRKVSVDGCEVIGQGAAGTVYRYNPDTIVKVFHNPDALPDIRRERELARKAFILGIPTAIPYDVVLVGDKYGSVFELLNAKSISKLVAGDPDNIDTYIAPYVEIMKKLHSTSVKPEDMPSMKEVAVGWAKFMLDYLPKEEGEKLYELVCNVPERSTMVHGDYHTNNVMMQGEEALLIDMDTLCYGHPIFELASMYMGFQAFGETDHSVTMNFLKMTYEQAGLIWNRALRMYLDGADEETVKDVERKAMLIAYMRLMRRTIRRNGLNTEDGRAVIECAHRHISEILPVLTTLDF